MNKEDFKKYEKKWISKEGYVCYVVFLDGRHRCGYVRVNDENITNEIDDYNDVPVNIHGGLTYGGNGIFGFDCAHYGDTLDKWTLEKVEEEVNSLSEQLSKLTLKDCINYKLRYMPDWFKKEISEAEKEKEDLKEYLKAKVLLNWRGQNEFVDFIEKVFSNQSPQNNSKVLSQTTKETEDTSNSKPVVLDNNEYSISKYAEEYPENWKKISNSKEKQEDKE